MADKYRDEGASVRTPKMNYQGPKVIDNPTEKEPGLEPVPLLETLIAPVGSYRKAAQLLFRGGSAKKLTDKDAKFAKGGTVKSKGGRVQSASSRGDGIAKRGKTKGRMV